MNEEHGSASNRLAAETFMPMMVEAFHDGLREAGSLSRWLLATLVAINGAAGISMLPLKLAMGAKLAAAGAFLLGIGSGSSDLVALCIQAHQHFRWNNARVLAGGHG